MKLTKLLSPFFCLFLYTNCDKDDSPKAIQFEPFNFDGVFTVSVQRIESFTNEPMIRENEVITQINDSNFQTATTATFTPEQLMYATEYGFKFYRNINNNEINIPNQNLAQFYANILGGYSISNEPHGIIIDANTFQLTYEVFFTTINRRFVATYTRNQ